MFEFCRWKVGVVLLSGGKLATDWPDPNPYTSSKVGAGADAAEICNMLSVDGGSYDEGPLAGDGTIDKELPP